MSPEHTLIAIKKCYDCYQGIVLIKIFQKKNGQKYIKDQSERCYCQFMKQEKSINQNSCRVKDVIVNLWEEKFINQNRCKKTYSTKNIWTKTFFSLNFWRILTLRVREYEEKMTKLTHYSPSTGWLIVIKFYHFWMHEGRSLFLKRNFYLSIWFTLIFTHAIWILWWKILNHPWIVLMLGTLCNLELWMYFANSN